MEYREKRVVHVQSKSTCTRNAPTKHTVRSDRIMGVAIRF
jgi:hypothetical protein